MGGGLGQIRPSRYHLDSILGPPPTKLTSEVNLKNVYRFSTITNILKYKKTIQNIKVFLPKIQRILSKKIPPKHTPKPFFRRLRRRKFGGARLWRAPHFPLFGACGAEKGDAPAAHPHVLHFFLGARLRRAIFFIFSFGPASEEQKFIFVWTTCIWCTTLVSP